MIYDVIILGAGASGLFCAAAPEFHVPVGRSSGNSAADRSPTGNGDPGARLILEATNSPAQKLLLAGGGRCNFTHGGEMKEFLRAYDTVGSYRGKTGSKAAAAFLRSSLYRYPNTAFTEWMAGLGVPSALDENDKVYPLSGNGRDVRDALLKEAERNGFSLLTGRKVEKISCFDGGDGLLWNVTASGAASGDAASGGAAETYTCRRLVIATGGVSYPATGSDGALFTVLERDLGLAVTDLSPSLVPIRARSYPYGDLSGISLPEVRVSIQRQGHKTVHTEGPLLFTHKDFSGPAVLDISRHASDAASDTTEANAPAATLLLNYIHPMTYEGTREYLGDDVVRPQDAGRLSAPEAFGLPKRFLRALIDRCGGSPKLLAKLLTQDAFPIEGVGGFEQAMVTRGGILLDQLDPHTMEARERPGLYIIGEALNVDGISGGYNLQMCWSTARAAAAACTTRG